MNPFEGMDAQTIASIVILGSVLGFLTLIVIATYVRNGVWKVFGVLLLTVLVFGVLRLARG